MFDELPGMKLEPFMQLSAIGLKRYLLLPFLVLLSAAAGHVRAQAPNSPIVFQAPEAITVALVNAPQVGSTEGGGGGSDRAQWLRVEWHYAVSPKGAVPFVDAIEFRVWVEGRDLYATEATTADGIPVALTGTVTYINLPETHDAYGVMYVPPSTLARYGSKAGPTDFAEKFNVHVEAYVGGTKMDLFDKEKPQDPNWYQSLKAIPNLLYRQDQCPFLLTDTARYPQLKALAPAQ
jgi:hypothetical protein